ncbi:hypothetical protein, partial [Streptomyces sp. NPDC056069]|uniref:hypothetical protein n=1 Tax=Streptomyces sp. NPDC056069 TaxID=3345702 RepID=UPI0035E08E5C
MPLTPQGPTAATGSAITLAGSPPSLYVSPFWQRSSTGCVRGEADESLEGCGAEGRHREGTQKIVVSKPFPTWQLGVAVGGLYEPMKLLADGFTAKIARAGQELRV